MHPHHKQILAEIKKYAGKGNQLSSKDSYILSGHPYYNVAVPLRRAIAKEWVAENADISNKEFIAILNSLFAGKSHEEKTVASYLLDYMPAQRKSVQPKHINVWLHDLVGWAEIDALCQNVFTAQELLSNWKSWEVFIRKLSKDKNIYKRRASLVFLTGPTHRDGDTHLRDLAFATMDSLKHEKPILITKAISWLLREMVAQHKKEVSTYLKQNEDTLPKIALREARRKIETGRK